MPIEMADMLIKAAKGMMKHRNEYAITVLESKTEASVLAMTVIYRKVCVNDRAV